MLKCCPKPGLAEAGLGPKPGLAELMQAHVTHTACDRQNLVPPGRASAFQAQIAYAACEHPAPEGQ